MFTKQTFAGAIVLLSMMTLSLQAGDGAGVVRISDGPKQQIQQTSLNIFRAQSPACDSCHSTDDCACTSMPIADCGCPEQFPIADCGCPEDCSVVTPCDSCNNWDQCGVASTCAAPEACCPADSCSTWNAGCCDGAGACGSGCCDSGCCNGCDGCNGCEECEQGFCDKYHSASCSFIGRNQRASRAIATHLSHSIDHCFRQMFVNGNKHCYFCPEGSGGKGTPPIGCYNMVYSGNSKYFDQRDGEVYAAQGYGMPIAVPLAPNVKQAYNYSWGVPASRLTRISRVAPPRMP